MKIALLGNCQLQQIGWYLKAFFQQQKIEHSIVWYEPIFTLGDKGAPLVPLFDALSSADRIYGQYHDARWNALSTESLSKYYSIKLVPTLESIASFPQLNYFTEGELYYQLYTVDFRMIDLFLSGVSVEDAPREYSNVVIQQDELKKVIEETAEKCRAKFISGQVVFDYSAEYLQAMEQEAIPYYVHNHPSNRQLQWLANQILADIGCTLVNFSNLPVILFDTCVPALDGKYNDHYRIRNTEIGLSTAAKVNYVLCSSYEKSFLEKQLELSVYRRLCKAHV